MREQALGLLRTAIGCPAADFRAGQWEAVEGLLRRERLLVVQRTGWGKSIIYFLATRLLRDRGASCTLLVSPLLALMRNQIEAAARIGVKAETINSSNPEDWKRVQGALLQNQVDVLLISPERLANQEFVDDCLLPIAGRVGLLVVDEAHCISDWGHDFRPDYQRIVRVLRNLPENLPVLATTATANDRVVRDVEQQLGPNLRTLRGPLARESLRLQNLHLPAAAARMAWIAHHLPRMPGSGIVYTLTVRDAIYVAAWLQSLGIDAQPYHGGMENADREALENRLLRNEVKVLVATVALGMGFDKPDLGFVVHFQRPASAVHYYQQVGRAGRAVPEAYGVLLSGDEDDEIADYFIRTAFPASGEVTEVLEAMKKAGKPVKMGELQIALNLSYAKLDKILRFLLLESPAPVQKTPQGYVLNPVRWRMPVERMERITAIRRREQARMREYLGTERCLMEFLATELNDPQAAQCMVCANCSGRGLSAEYPQELAEAAAAFLNHLDLPIEPRKQWPQGLKFEGLQGRISAAWQAAEGRALCRWGDPGFGDLVREGKRQTGRFSDRLVDASADLIRKRWHPQPAPQWVTWVPSLRNCTLVRDFAGALAEKLRLPLAGCIQKTRETEPQKSKQNSAQRIRNLENAFAIRPGVRDDAVLLVDDMVDSRWTLTVLALKLRQAGCGPVYPFALADSSSEDGD